jgi:hypothetical protein
LLVALAGEHRDGAEAQESTARQHHQHDRKPQDYFAINADYRS